MTDAQNKALYIAEQCRAAGMTLAGAAGVIANVEAESAWRSNNLEDQYNAKFGVSDDTYTAQVDAGTRNFIDYAGYGLIQWTANDRKQQMLQFHRARGKSISDFKTQVAFLIHEMKSYGRAWQSCATSDSPYRCGYDICVYYEIPANKYAQGEYRGNLANNWYNWLQQNSGQHSSVPDGGSVPAGSGSGGSAQPAKDDDGIEIPVTWPPRTIDWHCTGFPEIRLMQAALRLRGYNVLTDGIWNQGDSTDKALKKFQKSRGLDPDGCCGPKSWAALLDLESR